MFHIELYVAIIIDRIRFYGYHGYFPLEETQTLIDRREGVKVTVSQQILGRFVDRYR